MALDHDERVDEMAMVEARTFSRILPIMLEDLNNRKTFLEISLELAPTDASLWIDVHVM